jgi:hypothetical protein
MARDKIGNALATAEQLENYALFFDTDFFAADFFAAFFAIRFRPAGAEGGFASNISFPAFFTSMVQLPSVFVFAFTSAIKRPCCGTRSGFTCAIRRVVNCP